jgi:hypothetical protein
LHLFGSSARSRGHSSVLAERSGRTVTRRARCSTRSPKENSTITFRRLRRRSRRAGTSWTRSTRVTCSRRCASGIVSASARGSARATSPASTGRSWNSTTMRRRSNSTSRSGASKAAACAARRWRSRSPERPCFSGPRLTDTRLACSATASRELDLAGISPFSRPPEERDSAQRTKSNSHRLWSTRKPSRS